MATDTAVARSPATDGAATRLFAVSAVGTLSSLAALSAVRTADALLPHAGAPTSSSVLTPFPCVLAALLTFGRLPAPIGGYARPASISLGLLAYFCVAAIAAADEHDAAGATGADRP